MASIFRKELSYAAWEICESLITPELAENDHADEGNQGTLLDRKT
jgi:hypothetical protein